MQGMFGVLMWLIVAGALVVIESMTAELVCIWFALGSLLAALAAFVDAPFWIQLLIFLVSSVAVLIVGRPFLLEKLKVRKQATNADRVVGQVGVVKQEIDNLRQTGRVAANGLDWTARSELGDIIPVGMPVEVLRIDGVKLIVQALEQARPLESQAEKQAAAPSAMDQFLEPETQPGELYDGPEMPSPPDIELKASENKPQRN